MDQKKQEVNGYTTVVIKECLGQKENVLNHLKLWQNAALPCLAEGFVI